MNSSNSCMIIHHESWSRDRLLPFAVAFAGFWRICVFSKMPYGELIQRIPDDAFYYLVTARNFASSGKWTFDGTEPASGFHLLWGYLLAFFFRLFPNASLHLIFTVGSIFQVCCLSLASYLVVRASSQALREGRFSWCGDHIPFVQLLVSGFMSYGKLACDRDFVCHSLAAL